MDSPKRFLDNILRNLFLAEMQSEDNKHGGKNYGNGSTK